MGMSFTVAFALPHAVAQWQAPAKMLARETPEEFWAAAQNTGWPGQGERKWPLLTTITGTRPQGIRVETSPYGGLPPSIELGPRLHAQLGNYDYYIMETTALQGTDWTAIATGPTMAIQLIPGQAFQVGVALAGSKTTRVGISLPRHVTAFLRCSKGGPNQPWKPTDILAAAHDRAWLDVPGEAVSKGAVQLMADQEATVRLLCWGPRAPPEEVKTPAKAGVADPYLFLTVG